MTDKTKCHESVRVPLKKILLEQHKPLHTSLEKSDFIKSIFKETLHVKRYVSYLNTMYSDLKVLENLIQRCTADSKELRTIDWSALFRSEAILKDIAAFDSGKSQPILFKEQTTNFIVEKHEKRYKMLASCPEDTFLLAAHALLFYLAALFGGQKLEKRIQSMYGESAATNYYRFDNGSVKTLRVLFSQMKAFSQSLSDAQYERFVEELVHGWHFHGDIVGVELRESEIEQKKKQ